MLQLLASGVGVVALAVLIASLWVLVMGAAEWWTRGGGPATHSDEGYRKLMKRLKIAAIGAGASIVVIPITAAVLNAA